MKTVLALLLLLAFAACTHVEKSSAEKNVFVEPPPDINLILSYSPFVEGTAGVIIIDKENGIYTAKIKAPAGDIDIVVAKDSIISKINKKGFKKIGNVMINNIYVGENLSEMPEILKDRLKFCNHATIQYKVGLNANKKVSIMLIQCDGTNYAATYNIQPVQYTNAEIYRENEWVIYKERGEQT